MCIYMYMYMYTYTYTCACACLCVCVSGFFCVCAIASVCAQYMRLYMCLVERHFTSVLLCVCVRRVAVSVFVMACRFGVRLSVVRVYETKSYTRLLKQRRR